MSALTIDTFEVSQILKKHGFSDEQASGVVHALKEINAEGLSTKGDLELAESRLDAKIDTSFARLETVIANQKVEILRWLFATQLALGGFITAIIKFAH